MSVFTTLKSMRKAVKAGQAAHAIYTAGVEKLCKQYADMSREEVGEALRPHVAKVYGIALTPTGFDTDSKQYSAAKQFLYRVKNDIAPDVSNKREVRFTRKQRDAAKAFLAMFASKTAAKAALDLE